MPEVQTATSARNWQRTGKPTRKPRHRTGQTPGMRIEAVRDSNGTEALRLEGLAYRSGPAGETTIFDQFGAFREQIAPGAARDLIDRRVDTRFLVGHNDAAIPLARTRSGTFELREDDSGLRISAFLDPESTQANDLVSAVRRGDITGLSIRFAPAAGFDDWDDEMTHRVIRRFADLPEISAVWAPAYGTSTLTSPSETEAPRSMTARQIELELDLLKVRFHRPSQETR